MIKRVVIALLGILLSWVFAYLAYNAPAQSGLELWYGMMSVCIIAAAVFAASFPNP